MSAEQELIAVRARLAELEEKVEFLYRHFGIAVSSDKNQIDPRIIAAIKNKNLIEAIKVYREIYNVSLAEAKDAIENIQRSVL